MPIDKIDKMAMPRCASGLQIRTRGPFPLAPRTLTSVRIG